MQKYQKVTEIMKFKKKFLFNYLKYVPFALGIERSLECEILSKLEFAKPILDIGCGEGLFAYTLCDEKIDVGIDPDARELAQAKKFKIYDELIECYGDDIPRDSETYNTILSNSVLEHIPEMRKVLVEAHRLLKKGGRLFVTVPTDMFDKYTIIYHVLSKLGLKVLAEKYRKFFNRFWRHYNYHTPAEWKTIFNNIGFEIKLIRQYDSKFICMMNDFLVPFAMPSFIMKKVFNRWIAFPFLRQLYIFPFYLIVKTLVKKFKDTDRGGIVFFWLKKKGGAGGIFEMSDREFHKS